MTSSIPMAEDIRVARAGPVVTIELNRPAANHFDEDLLRQVADALDECGPDPDRRAVVLCSNGKHFCAGADFSTRSDNVGDSAARVYRQAVRIIDSPVPLVAA